MMLIGKDAGTQWTRVIELEEQLATVTKERDELVAAMKQITKETIFAGLIAKKALAKVGADKTGARKGKTRNCGDCKHWNTDANYDEWPCDREHKPRFYKPKSPIDDDWGWKKKCADFEELKK